MKTYIKEFQKEFDILYRRHGSHEVFTDFVEMAAISIRQSVGFNSYLEEQYMRIINKYDYKDERFQFGKLLGIVILALDESLGFRDFLGEVFGENDLGNSHIGQFFTPFDVSELMAKLTVGEFPDFKGIIKVQEPACGSGGMVLAFCKAAMESGINYQKDVFVSAIDVSPRAAHMAYIQLSLAGVPAAVTLGNTLTLEHTWTWYTPMYFISNIQYRMKYECTRKISNIGGQLNLFED